jgi:hypothetical protein
MDVWIPPGKRKDSTGRRCGNEVINRLCGPCSEFALAEHWYASTALEDLLGVPDSAVTKDRLYPGLIVRRLESGQHNRCEIRGF